MKKRRKLVMGIFTMLAFCILFANVQAVNAETSLTPGNIYVNYTTDAKGNIIQQKKLRITTYSSSVTSFDVRYGKGDKIANLKVNKKGLTAEITGIYNGTYHYGYGCDISLYATKPATYKVSFDVVNSAGAKRGSYTVQVQAVNNDDVIKKATFGKQTVQSNTGTIKKGVKTNAGKTATKVSGSSGKLKLTANSQYKITGIMVLTTSKSRVYTYKKIKNGKKITLSKNYEYIRSDAEYASKTSSTRKYTYIYVSYKDKFLGDTVTYSITRSRGRKEIKCVEKDGITGKRTTTYSRCPYATITLWQY